MKYVKVMFNNKSSADNNLVYKIDEVNVASNWNSQAITPKEMGGFNFSSEEKILRWLIRGDTLYEVEIPNDAEVINCFSDSAPNGVFRSNKIILHNPKLITDDIALDLYHKSNLPSKSYYKSLIGLAIRGYRNTCLELIKDKVNKDNIDVVLSEVRDFVKPYENFQDTSSNYEVYNEIMEYLYEIKDNLLISRFVDKKPYIKKITDDKIINITGESGSGKTYFSEKYIKDDNYIVIDTDIVFNDFASNNKQSVELRKLFKDKPKDYLIINFDEFYLKVLDYFKDVNKTIVIDSAQYRNLKDFSILKGEVIVIRSSIENCYQRVLKRWKNIRNNNYIDEEYQKYAERKKGMFKWYKGINRFLKNVDKL